MNKDNCKRQARKEIRNKMISLRVTKDQSVWMSDQNLSPTAIMQEALTELGYKKQ